MPTRKDIALDARFLAQERIVDALLRALAMREPELLKEVRNILIDTDLTHAGKPGRDETGRQQITGRLELASSFADDHGVMQDD